MFVNSFHSSLAKFCMDVDLSNTTLDRFFDVFITDTRSSMKYKWYTNFFVNFFDDIESDLWFSRVNTMYISYCYC